MRSERSWRGSELGLGIEGLGHLPRAVAVIFCLGLEHTPKQGGETAPPGLEFSALGASEIERLMVPKTGVCPDPLKEASHPSLPIMWILHSGSL